MYAFERGIGCDKFLMRWFGVICFYTKPSRRKLISYLTGNGRIEPSKLTLKPYCKEKFKIHLDCAKAGKVEAWLSVGLCSNKLIRQFPISAVVERPTYVVTRNDVPCLGVDSIQFTEMWCVEGNASTEEVFVVAMWPS